MSDQETLFRQMEKVRDEGRVNMMDRNGVMAEANRLKCYQLVVYLGDMNGTGNRTSPDGRMRYLVFLNQFGEWLRSPE